VPGKRLVDVPFTYFSCRQSFFTTRGEIDKKYLWPLADSLFVTYENLIGSTPPPFSRPLYPSNTPFRPGASTPIFVLKGTVYAAPCFLCQLVVIPATAAPSAEIADLRAVA